MSTSRVPAVIDALVALFTANLPGVTVYDGKYLTTPDGSFVTVGWQPEQTTAADASQAWVGLGALARDETFDVACYADAYTGDTATSVRRQAAYDLLATIEGLLRSDPLLGGAVANPGWAEVSTHSLRQEQTDAGLEVGVAFTVHVQTRI